MCFVFLHFDIPIHTLQHLSIKFEVNYEWIHELTWNQLIEINELDKFELNKKNYLMNEIEIFLCEEIVLIPCTHNPTTRHSICF